MGVLLGLLAAAAYGTSDFVGGLGGRRASVGALTIWSQAVSLLATLVALAVWGQGGPGTSALAWGAVSGVGAGVGTAVLYRGLAVARMGVVSPLSAVVSALVPAAVGISTGDRPSVLALVGMVAALPAIVLVSWHGEQETGRPSGVGYGLAAGFAFGSLFAALGQAGTASGPWPLVPGQLVALAIIVPIGLSWAPRPVPWRPAARFGIAAGALGGVSNLIFLAATGAGELAVVAVLTSLYPAITVLLAGGILGERWRRVQVVGLVASAAAVVLITVG